MHKRVAIAGSGISGLMAAWACEKSGMWIDGIIYSNSLIKPIVSGFQYLHEECELPLSHSSVLYESIVSNNYPFDICADLYSHKVYGKFGIHNSISKLEKSNSEKRIWNLQEANDFLWLKYKDNIKERNFVEFEDLQQLGLEFDLVISTIPMDVFFPQCESVDAYVMVKRTEEKSNKVFYDISPENSIYRYGHVFGDFFIESKDKIFENSRKVKKVIPSTYACDIPENMLITGRYGEWNKSVLANDVFDKVKEFLNG